MPYIQVKAQTTYTVSIFYSGAGSTTPSGDFSAETATFNYTAGSSQTFTATPSDGFTFVCWVIGTSSGATADTTNPLVYTVNSDISLQPVFVATTNNPIPTPPSTVSTVAVDLFASYGGTTNPTSVSSTAPYVDYNYATGSAQTFTATPDSGFQFLCWVIVTGNVGSTSTSATLSYTVPEAAALQAIFVPTGSTVTLPGVSPAPTSTSTPTSTATPISHFPIAETVGAVVVVVVVIAIATVLLLLRQRRKGKV